MKELRNRLSKLPEAVQLIDGVCSFHHTMLPLYQLGRECGKQAGFCGAREHRPKTACVAGLVSHTQGASSVLLSREANIGLYRGEVSM